MAKTISLEDILNSIDTLEVDQLVQVKEAAGDKLESMKHMVLQQFRADLEKKMDLFGFTAQDLGITTGYAPQPGKRARKPDAGPAKYINPETGETWAGKGRTIEWMQHQLAIGKSKDDFLNPEWVKFKSKE